MAQAMLSARLAARGVTVRSRLGRVLAGDRRPPAGGDRGHGRPGHRRQPATAAGSSRADDLAAADLILGLAREHVRHAAVLLPDGLAARVHAPRAGPPRPAGRSPARPASRSADWLARAAAGRDRPACSAAARPTTWPTRPAARCAALPGHRVPARPAHPRPRRPGLAERRVAAGVAGPFGTRSLRSFLRTVPGFTAIRQAPSATVACAAAAPTRAGGAVRWRTRPAAGSSSGGARASRVSSSGSSGLTWACLTSGWRGR